MTRPPDVRPAPAPTWFHGAVAAGTVGLRLRACATEVRVDLQHGWRYAVGPAGLGAALLRALAEASAARLRAWAADREHAAPAPPPPPEVLRRARRDLHEYREQLVALQRRRTVAGTGREIAVVTAGGQVVELRLDPAWSAAATDAELRERTAAALGAALRQCAAAPALALRGCPDLAAVLAGRPGAFPFPLPHPPGVR